MTWEIETGEKITWSINYVNHAVILCFTLKFTFQELNLAVVGSQIVGLVPLKAIMQSAEYYCEKEGLFILEEDQKIRLVSDWEIPVVMKTPHGRRLYNTVVNF